MADQEAVKSVQAVTMENAFSLAMRYATDAGASNDYETLATIANLTHTLYATMSGYQKVTPDQIKAIFENKFE